ncbi:hypothetical protein J5N97_001645 [Dioscorea zingiberensis]|uniref:DUF4408 domain-containing protein n=1 Tax=Dioscorea zingiberensis TaxID=325984 RepID=A0A9D5BTM4_9LILI|nr:hypothetical protein J5N97_001645 [Dioscorea zingiberensis]
MVKQHKLMHTASTSKAKMFSISIVISLPVLYVSLLHVPPSTLFSDTVFWFLISNTIIIIIATDSGIFSSSSENYELYNEFDKHNNRSRRSSLLPVDVPKGKTQDHDGEMKSNQLVHGANEFDKHNNRSRRSSPLSVNVPKEKIHDHDGEMKSNQLVHGAESINENEKKTQGEQVMDNGVGEERSDSEYVNMSDEELNKRVEEFIKRFKEIELHEEEMGNE